MFFISYLVLKLKLIHKFGHLVGTKCFALQFNRKTFSKTRIKNSKLDFKNN